MTILVNLAILAFAVVPLVGVVLAWRRWSDPSSVYVRQSMKIVRQINEAQSIGDYSTCHRLGYVLTTLAKQHDPDAEPFTPSPEMQRYFDTYTDLGSW